MKPSRNLTDNPAALQTLLLSTQASTGLTRRQIVHDYWLIRALSGIAERLPADGVFRAALTDKDTKKGRTEEMMPVKGLWAFGGGTSLTAAWKLSPRWSEDIDASIFQPKGSPKASFNTIRKKVTDMAAEAVGTKDETTGSATIAHTVLVASDSLRFKMDHVLETLSPEQVLGQRKAVAGLIARYSDDPGGLCEEFPELGGFELPVIEPAYIAVNKLDALHRRAATQRWEGLQRRFRDIYDLYHISRLQPHADLCRANVSQWWHRMNRDGGPAVDRPDGGYGNSPMFTTGSAAYDAIADAYNNGINRIAIGQPPTFEEVITAARTLDI